MRTFLADSLGADVWRVLHMSLCMSSGCQCLISQPVAQNLLGDVSLVFNVSHYVDSRSYRMFLAYLCLGYMTRSPCV